ncbi:MAG: hypothetical protein ACE14S_01900 [Candidatus Bathyarchaeia archaeon]
MNPYINNPIVVGEPQEPTPITGQTAFDFVIPYLDVNPPIRVFYNVTSKTFTTNNPVNVNLKVEFLNYGPFSDLFIAYATARIDTAVDVGFPPPFVNLFPPPSEFELQSDYNITIGNDPALRYYSGNETVLFQSTEIPKVKFTFYLQFLPELQKLLDERFNVTSNRTAITIESEYMRKWQPFRTEVVLQNVTIELAKVTVLERQQIQQANELKFNEKVNLSLTLIVIFLMFLDVAMATRQIGNDYNKDSEHPRDKNQQDYVGDDI